MAEVEEVPEAEYRPSVGLVNKVDVMAWVMWLHCCTLLYWKVVIVSEHWYKCLTLCAGHGGSSFDSLLVMGSRQTSTPAS